MILWHLGAAPADFCLIFILLYGKPLWKFLATPLPCTCIVKLVVSIIMSMSSHLHHIVLFSDHFYTVSLYHNHTLCNSVATYLHKFIQQWRCAKFVFM